MGEQQNLDKLAWEKKEWVDQIKRLEARDAELIKQKQQFDAIFDNIPAELYLKDRQGRYLKINKHFEKIFNVKNADLVGKLPDFALDPELAASSRNQDLAVLKSGRIETREEKAFLATDSHLHTLFATKFPVFDTQGEVDGLGAVVFDITDLKAAENRFLNIVNTIDGVFWEYDIAADSYVYVSSYAEKLLGYPVENWKDSGFWVSTMHEEDQAWVPARNQKLRYTGQPNYETEYRIVNRDGHVIWVRDLVTISTEHGKPRWLSGIMVDISLRKEAEASVQSTRSRFQTMFLSAPVGMLLLDLNTTNILEINPAYCKIVGRSVKEIKQVGWEEMTHPDDLEENKFKLKQLQDGEIDHFKMTKRFVKPDNQIVWTELTVSMIHSQMDPENLQYLAILEDITDRRNFEEKVWKQANFDFLTGLPNRNMLTDRLSQSIKKANRDNREFAMLLIDLDQFKDVNDTLGHDRGDELLIETTNRLNNCVRESDTVARLGGDEFVIILSELSYLSGVGMVAKHINEVLCEPFLLGKEIAYISASIGITLFPKDATDAIDLMKNADQAMYAAKNQGRNGYHFFTPLMQHEAHRHMQLVNDLHDAIRNEDFILHYQPIVELKSDSIFRAEALVRWQHEDIGLIYPNDFIKVAEETRMINEIGDWVFLVAAKQCQRWQEKLGKGFQISVNVSPIQLESETNFSWQKYLKALQIDGALICIEITESLILTSNDSALGTLLKFRDAGIQVSIDDFGTGYSSLSYLRKFDIDYLKIDQSFVQNLDHGSDDLALCSAIVVMAHKLGIKVIAEGIETLLQKELLLSIGCDYGQGFLFSEPLPSDEFETFVTRGH